MLVLSRKANEQIQIGPNITITILKVKGLAVRIGIEAPDDVKVMRTEVTERLAAEAAESSSQTVENKQKRRGSADRGHNHPGETHLSPSTEPSAESPRCRVPRLRLTPPDYHPLRSGPASAADGLARMPARGNLTT
jgi:carbon storage regulator CsrA